MSHNNHEDKRIAKVSSINGGAVSDLKIAKEVFARVAKGETDLTEILKNSNYTDDQIYGLFKVDTDLMPHLYILKDAIKMTNSIAINNKLREASNQAMNMLSNDDDIESAYFIVNRTMEISNEDEAPPINFTPELDD